jgi:hypothetical protein
VYRAAGCMLLQIPHYFTHHVFIVVRWNDN